MNGIGRQTFVNSIGCQCQCPNQLALMKGPPGWPARLHHKGDLRDFASSNAAPPGGAWHCWLTPTMVQPLTRIDGVDPPHNHRTHPSSFQHSSLRIESTEHISSHRPLRPGLSPLELADNGPHTTSTAPGPLRHHSKHQRNFYQLRQRN